MPRLALALVLILAATAAMAHDHESFSVDGDDCTARNFRWDGENAFVERQVIDGSGLRSIKASVTHAPISVTGDSTNGGYSIDVCKAASRREDLAAIRVSFDGNRLQATGPDGRRWVVIYRIHAPRNADVEVDATNGPLSLKDVDGRIVARTKNGPLSLRNVSGDVDATTNNGPLSVTGGSGTVKVAASNGPLSVKLEGASFNGTLDASTKNGPLSLKLPRGYNSGVVVETNGRGPVACKAEGCGRYHAVSRDDDWDDHPRRIELGNGAANVRLSTVNGPVTIKDE